jgi:arginase
LNPVLYRPDLENPTQQNLALVRDVAQRVDGQVSAAAQSNAKPIVMGGDCTITLGVLAALTRHLPDLGLIYFDGDVDLNTPETTTSGIFDGMVMSHITGEGAHELTHLGSRYPLMPAEKIVLFGYNAEAGWMDAAEIQRLEAASMIKYPAEQIRGKARPAAIEALTRLEKKVQHILVHFDVDVIDCSDFPAADVIHDHGLGFGEAMDALGVFASSSKFAGLVVTEFNSERDEDGSLAQRLVDALVMILGNSHASWVRAGDKNKINQIT